MPDAALDKQLLDLLMAAQGLDAECTAKVRALVAQGADLHALGAGRTALHWAARAGDVDSVKALLELGADPNRAGEKGITALHEAVWVGARKRLAVACVQALLDGGASPTVANADGGLPLHDAARNGLARAVDVLAPRSPLEQPKQDGTTALQIAIIQSEWPIVQRLLQLGARVDEACLAKATVAPRRIRELLVAARENRPQPTGEFAKLAALLAEHLDDGPAADVSLTPEQVRALLEQLAAALGRAVEQGLGENTDVDHFEKEYGDDWLEELLDSYWSDAHSRTLEQAWESLPEGTRAALPALEALSETWRSRYVDAALAEDGSEDAEAEDEEREDEG